jgi:hypothetical protein
VLSTFALLSAISENRSLGSSIVGNPCAMASLEASWRPITEKTLLRSELIAMVVKKSLENRRRKMRCRMTHEDDNDVVTVTTTTPKLKSVQGGNDRQATKKYYYCINRYGIDDDISMLRLSIISMMVVLLIVTVSFECSIDSIDALVQVTLLIVTVLFEYSIYSIYAIVRCCGVQYCLMLSFNAVGYCNVLHYPILGEYWPHVTLYDNVVKKRLRDYAAVLLLLTLMSLRGFATADSSTVDCCQYSIYHR